MSLSVYLKTMPQFGHYACLCVWVTNAIDQLFLLRVEFVLLLIETHYIQ